MKVVKNAIIMAKNNLFPVADCVRPGKIRFLPYNPSCIVVTSNDRCASEWKAEFSLFWPVKHVWKWVDKGFYSILWPTIYI